MGRFLLKAYILSLSEGYCSFMERVFLIPSRP